MSDRAEILGILDEFQDSWEGISHSIRLDLSEIMVRRMRVLKWSQRDLAVNGEIDEARISRFVHSSQNFTVDGAAKLLHLLGVRRANLVESSGDASVAGKLVFVNNGHADGEEEIEDSSTTGSEDLVTYSGG